MFGRNRNLYFISFRQFNYWQTFCILYFIKLTCGSTEAYGQTKTYIIAKPINSHSNLSNETYIYQPEISGYPNMPDEQEVQDFKYNPYSYYYLNNNKHNTIKPYYFPEDKLKYSVAPNRRSKKKFKSIKSKYSKKRRQYSTSPYNTNIYDSNQFYDSSYPNSFYNPKGKGSTYDSYGLGYKSKTKYGNKQQIPENSVDYDDYFNLDNIFDLSDDDLEDLDEKAEDLLFGDYQDPLQEETFVRPAVVGLNSGVKLAAAGLNGISHVLPGVWLGGLRGLILGTVLGLPRFSAGKLIGGGIRIFIAIMLLPLILLFLPLPMFSPPANPNNSQRHSENEASKPQSNQFIEFGRRVLSSENCIERISCEINHFNEITGMETENIWFTRFMHIVSSFEGLFPDFLIRMARGYMNTTDDNSCRRFECNNLSNHLSFE